ncbi:hypothetical protein ACP4OV_030559 [Aristida adscensionis]
MVSSPTLRNLKFLYQLVANLFIVMAIVSLITAIFIRALQFGPGELLSWFHAFHPSHIFLAALLPAAAITSYNMAKRSRAIYLVDYACFKPSSNFRVSLALYKEHLHLMPYLDDRTVKFMERMLDRSGLGDETSVPPAYTYIPPSRSFSEARDEAKLVIFSVLDDLFSKTFIDPAAIEILIVNCSLFAPTPSYSDMIINRYKLRSDINNMHLSGMGCSASMISVGLAKNLLQTKPHGTYALVVSTETISDLGMYKGKKRSMHLPNILFRIGGAAVLISNSRHKARFQLNHLQRTITTTESAYHSVILEEDEHGNLGINLSKDLIAISADAFKTSLSAIAPYTLPTSEMLRFLLSYILRKMFNDRMKPYMPNFCLAVEHFCIHPGGPAVIDAVQSSLRLSDVHVEPSRMTLHRFGNTSSSSLWYELAYIEAKGRMQKGNRVLMIAFGSGYKCNIAVWQCLQPPYSSDASWANCIHQYPVEARKV